MKIIYLLLLVIFCLPQCYVLDEECNGIICDIQNGQIQWQKTEAANPNYYYERHIMSWTGFRYKTLIGIQKKGPTVRLFKSSDDNDETTHSYTESGAQIGEAQQGHEPLNMDELYEECLAQINEKQAAGNHEFYIDIADNGVLINCKYRQLSCIDDCTQGPNTDLFEFGMVNDTVVASFFGD